MELPLAHPTPQEATQELWEIIQEINPLDDHFMTRAMFAHDPITVQQDRAIEAVYIEDIRELIDQGADINTVDENGLTILAVAAMAGFSDMVHYLLSRNANPNIPTAWPPLLDAVHWGYEDIVQMLLGAGAQVNMQGSDGDYALKIAIEKGYREIAALLMAEGAIPTLIGDEGRSAIDAAQGKPEMMELFAMEQFP